MACLLELVELCVKVETCELFYSQSQTYGTNHTSSSAYMYTLLATLQYYVSVAKA